MRKFWPILYKQKKETTVKILGSVKKQRINKKWKRSLHKHGKVCDTIFLIMTWHEYAQEKNPTLGVHFSLSLWLFRKRSSWERPNWIIKLSATQTIARILDKSQIRIYTLLKSCFVLQKPYQTVSKVAIKVKFDMTCVHDKIK